VLGTIFYGVGGGGGAPNRYRWLMCGVKWIRHFQYFTFWAFYLSTFWISTPNRCAPFFWPVTRRLRVVESMRKSISFNYCQRFFSSNYGWLVFLRLSRTNAFIQPKFQKVRPHICGEDKLPEKKKKTLKNCCYMLAGSPTVFSTGEITEEQLPQTVVRASFKLYDFSNCYVS
jgi:hypothetical protein